MTNDTTQKELQEMQAIADKIRVSVLDMVYKAQSGHLGGSFSAAEIVTSLYFGVMRIDPQNPRWPDRDRLVPSKGHCAPTIYTALFLKGVLAPEALDDLRQMGCILQGHPCMNKVPGIDVSTGSLGHGLSIGVGMALGAKLMGKDFRVFVLLGDGELNEGQNWEAAMSASKHSLDNLIAIVDRNGVQLDGPTEKIMPLEPLAKKWESFNWQVRTIDGHDIGQIMDGIRWAEQNNVGPSVIIANTVKGKGVSFMENSHVWHGKPPSKEEYEMARRELEGR